MRSAKSSCRDSRKVGRPCKLTPEVQERITQALNVGAYRAEAAIYAGIAASTFYSWMERGEADREHDRVTEFSQFVDAVELAEARSEILLLGLITKAAERDWNAARWRLERKARTRWGSKESQELTPEQFATYVKREERRLLKLREDA